jgi:LacI family transcriptional regulator
VDNWLPLAISCRPPLTTVDLQLDEIGRVAAEELLGKASQRRPSGSDKWA